MSPSPVYLLLVLPALLIFIIVVGSLGSRRAQNERIEELREKVKALPLDENTLKKRLEIFDDICRKEMDYNRKIILLERLASGKIVSMKRVRKERKRSPSSSYGESLGWSLHNRGCLLSQKDYYKVPISGIASRITLGHY